METYTSASGQTARDTYNEECKHQQKAAQSDRASSEASSSTTYSSEDTDHPVHAGRTSHLQEDEENSVSHTITHTASRVVSREASILTERTAADVQHVAHPAGVQRPTSSTRGKRKNRQGQKSKEAYNRKRRERKKSERRERAAAARQLTGGHAGAVTASAPDAASVRA